MASRTKSRNSGKSQSPTPSPGHGRKSARGKDVKHSKEVDEDKEKLAFKVLSADNSKKFSEINDVDQLQDAVVELLELKEFDIDLQQGSVVDYYVAAVWWCKEQGYSAEQLSTFYTVAHNLLNNIKEKQMTLVDNLKEFKKMLVGIGVEQNPENPIKVPTGGLDGVFDVTQASEITNYVNTSLFQHYKLFEFVFSHSQAEEIIGTDLVVDVPLAANTPWPPPLDEGVTEELHRQHIATPPPTPEQEAPEGEEAAGGEEEISAEDAEREADILAQLTPEQISEIMESVFAETLGGLETEVAAKLRDKENAYINRINKIHKVAE